MKNLFALVIGLGISVSAFGQITTDTLYYDKNWEGVEHPAFASYFRVIPQTADSTSRKPFRDYYITGELQSEGGYITIDKQKDANSIFDGEFVNYYKSGKIEQKGTRNHGKQEGEYTRYREDGLIELHAHMKNDKLHGLYTQFLESGDLCYQVEYWDGEPLNDYAILSNKEGYLSKIRLSDNQPIYDTPLLSEKQTEYKDGVAWPYYQKNGLTVGMTTSTIRDYGKYFQIQLIIVNNSMFPIEFDPDQMVAFSVDNAKNARMLKIYTADEYLRKVKRAQNWNAAVLGISAGLAASGAGFSTATTRSSYSGRSSRSSFYGQTTSTTTVYNGAAAYQAQVIASGQTAAYRQQQLLERQIKNEGYLKRTTIHPGESVSGYINIEYHKRATLMVVDVNICNAIYSFSWD